MIEINVENIERLARAVGTLRVLDILRAPLIASMAIVVDRMAEYPPQRSGSSYRRTGTLGRRWTQTQPVVEHGATELSVSVGNVTEYGPYVQSATEQRRIFRRRWQTDEQVLAATAGTITGIINRAVQTELDQI